MARDLLGKVLVHEAGGRSLAAVISETEAYLGAGDPASHAHRGPTPRSRVMFGPPGRAYVYLIYGMHHCLNAVTEPEGIGAAVLIRALRPIAGREPQARMTGPALVCRALDITLEMNGWDLQRSALRVLTAPAVDDESVLVGPRVGISAARDLPLRFRLAPG